MAATSGPGVVPARHGFVELLRVAGEVGAVQHVEAVMRAKVGACPGRRPRLSTPFPVRPGDAGGFHETARRAGYPPPAPWSGVDGLVRGRASVGPSSDVSAGTSVVWPWGSARASPRVDGFVGIPVPLVLFLFCFGFLF